jgi:hypothetical protein
MAVHTKSYGLTSEDVQEVDRRRAIGCRLTHGTEDLRPHLVAVSTDRWAMMHKKILGMNAEESQIVVALTTVRGGLHQPGESRNPSWVYPGWHSTFRRNLGDAFKALGRHGGMLRTGPTTRHTHPTLPPAAFCFTFHTLLNSRP